jgi:hypothetical protein
MATPNDAVAVAGVRATMVDWSILYYLININQEVVI